MPSPSTPKPLKMPPAPFPAMQEEGPMLYAGVFWLAVGVAVLGVALEALTDYRVVGYVFLLFVLALGVFFPRGPVVFGALLSALIWDVGFIPPRFTLTIGSADDAMMLAAFLATAASVGLLTTRLRRLQQDAERRARSSAFLYETAGLLERHGQDDEALRACLNAAEARLHLRLGLAACDAQGVLQNAVLAPSTFFMGLSERRQAQEALRQKQPMGWEQPGSFGPRLLALPLDGEPLLGMVLLCRRDEGQSVSDEDRELLEALVGQLAQHLQRRRLREKSQEAEALRASEHLHQALFDSISHELRTPLTTLLAGAAALQGPAGDDPAARAGLAQELGASAERLDRTIGNLLDSARLGSGRLELRRDWQDPAELLRLIVQRLGAGLQRHRLELALDADLPLLHVDYRLLEHALANLILNAAAYAPAGSLIRVSAQARDGQLRIDVADQGPGIPAAERERVFEKFYRLPGSPAGGTGLGLHIARSLLRAHGGDVAALEAEGGGALLRVTLPLTEAPAAPAALETA